MGAIYVITNHINNKQYVGQTSRTIEKRYKEHLYAACMESPAMAIDKAIKKYGKDNFSISQLEECDNSQLDEKEIYWINELDTYHLGYNMTRGGQQLCDSIKCPVVLIDIVTLQKIASYESMSEAIRQFGSHVIECCNHKKTYLKNGIIAYKKDEYERYSLKELQNDVDSRVNVICQLDYYERLIKQWPSTRAIARYYNCNWGTISACCLDHMSATSAIGYIWCYRKDLFKHLNKIHSYNNTKPIIQFSKDKQQIKIWLSAAEVEKELSIPNSQLSRCCIKNSKRDFNIDKLATCHGFIWIFAPKEFLYCD